MRNLRKLALESLQKLPEDAVFFIKGKYYNKYELMHHVKLNTPIGKLVVSSENTYRKFAGSDRIG